LSYIAASLLALAISAQQAPEGVQPPAVATEIPVPVTAPADSPAPQPLSITLPAMTPVDIEILTPLNSKTTQIGTMFDIKLAQPIMLDGNTLVPAGALGKGEVVHAAKARAMGKAGEMILAARFIEFGGQKIKLRSFKFGPATGQSKRDEAFVASQLLLPAVLFIAGGNIDIPAGFKANAKTAEDMVIYQQEGQ
jgi:hypothetical protein